MGQAEAIILFASTLIHSALILLPCFALCVLAVRRGVHDPILAGLIGLIAIGISGYLAFWLWFISPKLGHIFSLSLPLAAALFLGWGFPRLDTVGRRTVNTLVVPISLIATSTMLVLSAGFMFGGLENPSMTARTRFSHALPPDNDVPLLFAKALEKGHIRKPLLGEWHSSDRPPLQTGIVLSQSGYVQHPRNLQYTVISVVLQSQWIFALWLFLTAFDLDSRCVALALAVCLFSGFIFLNSFYVWPKLLAATYMLGFSAVLLARRFADPLQRTIFVSVLAGALAVLGLLAHGASVFSIFGVILTLVVLKRRVALKSSIVLGLTVFCLYLPWILYQKFYDPPGDRLLKWHLAGVIALDSRSFIQAFVTSYRNLTFQQFLGNKLASLTAILDHQAEYWHFVLQLVSQMGRSGPQSTATAQTAAAIRILCFFFFVPNLGFLIAGPISLFLGIAGGYRSRECKTAAICWVYVILTAAVWCLLMFVPGKTVLHQSTYVMVLLAVAGSILALWSVSRWLAVVVGSLQIAINFLVFIAFLKPDGALRFATAGLAMLSLLCTLFLFKRLALWRNPIEQEKARQACSQRADQF